MKITRKSNPNPFEKLTKKQVQVGWFDSSTYENGMKVAQVAFMNEFGSVSKNQPPRPFLRNAIKDNSKHWSKVSFKVAKDIVNGANVLTSLNLLGVVVESDIKKSITQLTSPALKESTIKARKSKVAKGRNIKDSINKPLIDSGLMLATLSSEVK